jgi:hypothetical protein
MSTRKSTFALIGGGLLAAALATGCTSLQTRASGLGGYQEFEHDGRIYVLSRPATIRSFEASHEAGVTVMKIGAGPGGKTVVLEADSKDPFLSDTLWKMFRRNHGMD